MTIDIFSYKPKATLGRLVLLAVFSFLILIVFGMSLSPFNDMIVYDTVVFKMMGMAWREGFIPYRDFFDHKGPLHYLIQLISFSISSGKTGLLILETLNTAVIFELLYRCGKDLGADIKLNLLSLCVSMTLFAVFLGQGDNVEEWSLPFQIFPLWLAIKYLKGTFYSTNKLAFISGLCFGATALIRLNDNCIICGVVIGLTIVLLSKKLYRELLRCVIYFMIGMIAFILPFIAYFYINDALSNMIYCNFIFNFHYKSNPQFCSFGIRYDILLQLIQCLILPFTSWIYDRRNNTRIFPMMTAMSLLSFYVFIFSVGFGHYFLMVMPIATLCILTSNKFYISIVVSFCVMFLTVKVPSNYDICRSVILRTSHWNYLSANSYRNIILHIPENERNSIYTYGWTDCIGELLHYNILPIGKYAYLQNMLCEVDSVVSLDIKECFEKSKPKWIISAFMADQMKPLCNVSSEYKLAYHYDCFFLYRRKN